MGRQIAFDLERAVDRATSLFWERGYAETGLRDLLKVMEIGEGSFYNTVKSKKQLYLLCVQRYEDTIVHRRLEKLASAATAADGIRAFFHASLDALDAPDTPSRLCLIAGMTTEEVLAEPELRARAESGLEKVRVLFCERLSQDRERGLLPQSLDPPLTSSVITTYLQGLWRMALVGYDRVSFERQIDVFLAGLGLPFSGSVSNPT